MSIINFSNTRQMEGLFDAINPIKELIESKINLSRTADREKRINLNQNKVMRICFIVGLSLPTKRSIDDYKDITIVCIIHKNYSKFFHNARFKHLIFGIVKTKIRRLEH